MTTSNGGTGRMNNKQYNLFALQGDKVSDERIVELLGLTALNAHTPQLNIELLEEVRKVQTEKYPNDAEDINSMIDKAIYYSKVKLAARGMYHNDEDT